MKIAKKVLAVVIALAIVSCCAVMSFAAEDKVTLKASEIVDGKFKVEVIGKNYADLAAADWVVTYDAAVLNCTNAVTGKGDFAGLATDPALMAQASGQLMTAFNFGVDGEVKAGFAFQGTLGTADEAVLFTMDFVLEDAAAKNIEIKLTGTDEATIVINEEAPEAPSTEAPQAPSTEAPTAPSTEAGKDDGGANTGDTGALAIAAGVVALAGAAFVVSKKKR